MLNTTSHFYFHRRCRWQFAIAACGATAALNSGHLHAQATTATAVGNATVLPAGPRTGANGTNYFNVEGSSNGANASFGVLDFSASAFNLSNSNVSGVQGGTISLTLTENNGTFTKAGPLEFYLSTNNSASIVAGTSTLKYQTATAADPSNSPYGIDPQLGAIPGSTGAAGNSYSLFDLGSATFTPQATNFQADTYVLTLSTTAMQAFVNSLGSAGGSDIRLVMAGTTATTAATYTGATNSFASERPMLSFTPTYSTANNLDWQGGNSTWTATGGTNWNTANNGTGTTAWNNDGTHSAVFAQTGGSTVLVDTGINAAGLEFDTNGYVLNPAAAGNTLTLSGSGPIIQVTNATDTATVNVALGETSGFIKTGAGTLVLGGVSTYTGTTAINAGTVSISADANLGNGGAVALNGGTLQTTGSFTAARAFSGSGGIGVTAGNTLTVSGVVNMGALTLPGGGTLFLTGAGNTLANGADNAFTGLTFQTAGASLQTRDNLTGGNDYGIVNLGGGGITAAQTSGSVSATAIFLVGGTGTAGTVPISVANAAATLNLSGVVSGAAVLAKTGAGTLAINSDNSGLTGLVSTANPQGATVSFRQGSAGANPVNGGTVSIRANADPTVNVGAALGNAEYQANGGTLSNDTGAALVLTISDISLGAQDATATPGGLVFAGANAITVNGPISMFNSGTALYQHAITVNTPTTVTGILSAATGTATKSLGLTLRGSSTLTLNAAARGTMTEPITVATSGPNAGVIALAEGTFAANTAVTINGGASLTIQTGVTTGTTDAINDAALLTINGTAGAPGSFGKLVLTLGQGVQESVGGFYLPVGDGTLAAGYQPAGTYGATGSGAKFIDNTLFSGMGVINNLSTVPEPSTWAALGLGGLLGLAAMRRRRSRTA